MRTKTTKAMLLFFLMSMLLSSCSLFPSAEEKNRQLAADTAVAYFTFDYQHPETWMESVNKEDYYENFIKKRVKPDLVLLLKKYFIKSNAQLVSLEEYARGVNSDDAELIIWEIHLQVNPPWPGSEPPASLNQPSLTIPWTNMELATGDTTNAVVYAVATSKYKIWTVKLISSDQVEEVMTELVIP